MRLRKEPEFRNKRQSWVLGPVCLHTQGVRLGVVCPGLCSQGSQEGLDTALPELVFTTGAQAASRVSAVVWRVARLWAFNIQASSPLPHQGQQPRLRSPGQKVLMGLYGTQAHLSSGTQFPPNLSLLVHWVE